MLEDSTEKTSKNKIKIACPKGLCEMREMWHIRSYYTGERAWRRGDVKKYVGTITQDFPGLNEKFLLVSLGKTMEDNGELPYFALFCVLEPP